MIAMQCLPVRVIRCGIKSHSALVKRSVDSTIIRRLRSYAYVFRSGIAAIDRDAIGFADRPNWARRRAGPPELSSSDVDPAPVARLEIALRTGVSETLLGQKTAKQAPRGVASEWRRNLRRAGIVK
jgi:hypothetical protein